ncbi:uncharacterized protein FPRO_01801 [Fusarium proliferatum ET1]|uniref:BTB domain-containing protein n=1 Tax=Fusarium proliferatum (strain ET1) TaxID=1227346 RepID=A0A1L7UZF8_FUSPR|nr:uncharacterized protein FPRO_01801 [Fusarium proliferatum ET1]CZR33323.1 uncharacterized protein FPRO_01801 [Fusarium proliferatum ET1]
MNIITHDIVPGGDLCIILKEPNTQRVLPDVSLRQYQYNMPDYLPDHDRLDAPPMISPLPYFRIHDEEPVEIRLRVSSAHMTLASPVIKKMLQGPWTESAEIGSPDSVNTSSSPSTSVREISTIGWNADALVALLNIIHCRHSDVPTKVNLSFFADFALIVDYYQCDRAVLCFPLLWHNSLYRAPEGFGRKPILWLYISWVFSWHETFPDMAMLIWKHGEGLDLVKTYDLPLAEILENLDNKRQEAIKTVLGELDNIIGELQEDQFDDTFWGGGWGQTDHARRCMTLGSALREKRRLDKLDPPLTAPYTGYPFSKMISMVHEFRSIDGHVEDHEEYVSDDGDGWGPVPEQEQSPKSD